jgi:hypothetical protein
VPDPALRRVYSAANAEEAEHQLELIDEQWGERYPMVAQAFDSGGFRILRGGSPHDEDPFRPRPTRIAACHTASRRTE